MHEYPGIHAKTFYTEGVFVGYRYFDDQGNEPLFPFGHGLSYSEFEFSNRQVTPKRASSDQTIRVDVPVENTGDRSGKEVVQAYVTEEQARVHRPPRELRGFQKVELAPGERTRARLALDRDALSYYDKTE
jgi:beta-glucosidase